MKLVGLGITPIEYSKSGWPSVTSETLSHLAGNIKKEKYGPAYKHFGGGEEGKNACIAIDALSKYGSIETMIGSFLQPLQSMVDKDSRVHGSFNLNTETGRLSSRNPNLQNQPALDKDKYFVRKAFTCDDDHILIVSDYSQLELRVLAHMTNCKSMLDAFLLGGDFHSRTAYGMYDNIKEAVAQGKVRLETGPDTDPNIPTIKDVFASERKKAKVLNFSIAYGKTARGLSKDFGVSVQEAQETLNKWYRDRPEVKEWQEKTIQYAHQTGYTRTLMGRYRRLPHINSKSAGVRSHMERAAINTPIQGGAADIVMMAMLKVHHDERIKEKGYKMVIQVHDEIMMDGPEEYKDEVLKMVKDDMEHPFKNDLLVALTADANYAKTWYEAK